jgi:hypothetical protein
MEIIAMGDLRDYLKENLPKYKDPIVFISSKFIPGCPKCDSSTSVYYITLTERDLIPNEENIEKAYKHKFPIDIYVQYTIQKGKPKKFIVGTKRTNQKLQMILRKVLE